MHQRKFLAALILSVAAIQGHASPQLFVEQGCYNCHGLPKPGVPSMQDLSNRLSRIKGDDAAQQRFYDHYRKGEALERVDAHGWVAPDTAKQLIRWLAEGGGQQTTR